MIAFADVDITSIVAWLRGIPFRDWPQQRAHVIYPAMVTDLEWHSFGATVQPIVDKLLIEHFSGCTEFQQMLSAVMPGNEIEPHRDEQAPYWVGRVHVPLISNDYAWFYVEGQRYRMVPGRAYCVDTRLFHAVKNHGDTPRVHFMFDVRK